MKEILGKVLSKNESIIYYDLLESGLSKATTIAKRTKLARNKVYDALNRLESKNLVSVENSKVKAYAPNNPSKFLNFVEEQFAEQKKLYSSVSKAMPELHTIYENKKNPLPTFTYTRGKKEIAAEIRKELVSIKKFFYIFARRMAFFEESGLITAYKRLIKNGLDMRVITIDDPEARLIVKKMGVNAIFIPKEMQISKTFVVKDNKFVISFHGADGYLRMKTESKEVVEAFKSLFLVTWEMGSKNKTS